MLVPRRASRRLDPAGWLDANRLAEFSARHRFATLLLAVPAEEPLEFIRELGERVAPAVRTAGG